MDGKCDARIPLDHVLLVLWARQIEHRPMNGTVANKDLRLFRRHPFSVTEYLWNVARLKILLILATYFKTSR